MLPHLKSKVKSFWILPLDYWILSQKRSSGVILIYICLVFWYVWSLRNSTKLPSQRTLSTQIILKHDFENNIASDLKTFPCSVTNLDHLSYLAEFGATYPILKLMIKNCDRVKNFPKIIWNWYLTFKGLIIW